MSDRATTRGMIGKNKERIQAVIHKSDREMLQKLAEVQDRSESYVIAKIIEEYLHGSKVKRKK